MINKLLDLISYEKLILVFKEKNLFEEFTLHKEILAIRNAQIIKIADSDLLKQILPKDIFSTMFAHGNLNLLAFTFALRHRILVLNQMFSLSALQIFNPQQAQQKKIEFIQKFGKNFDSDYHDIQSLLSAKFWSRNNRLPILGFSALGCHFSLRSIGTCRAFDAYDIPCCQNQSETIYCSNHAQEIFWYNSIAEDASTQAKMSQFYLYCENFNQFNEQNLKEMMDDFFEHFKTYKKSRVFCDIPQNITSVLDFYSFSGIEDLKNQGVLELRKRFLEKAKILHPDTGGAHEKFRDAREKYELLREILLQ